MELRSVTSSNIKAIGYDEDAHRLVVEFHTGKKYAYREVPPGVHEALMGAKSIGLYFGLNIRGKYGTEKL